MEAVAACINIIIPESKTKGGISMDKLLDMITKTIVFTGFSVILIKTNDAGLAAGLNY